MIIILSIAKTIITSSQEQILQNTGIHKEIVHFDILSLKQMTLSRLDFRWQSIRLPKYLIRCLRYKTLGTNNTSTIRKLEKLTIQKLAKIMMLQTPN